MPAQGYWSDDSDLMPHVPPSRTPNGPQAYKGNSKHKWEEVTPGTINHHRTTRLRVPSGWLYRYGDGDPVFVPMPEVVGYKV